MPRGGRYRFIPVVLWLTPRFQALSADARLLLLNLRTGSTSNLPGIHHVYQEALERETGLTAGEIRNAFAELAKEGFVVVDRGIAWVKDQLKTDPSRPNDAKCANPQHRTAIETILGSLPRESLAVQKFRKTYKFPLHRVSRTPSRTPSHTLSHTVGASPDTGYRIPDTGEQRTEIGTGKGERERENPAAVTQEILETERRLYGRELTHLQRKGRQPVPPRLDGR